MQIGTALGAAGVTAAVLGWLFPRSPKRLGTTWDLHHPAGSTWTVVNRTGAVARDVEITVVGMSSLRNGGSRGDVAEDASLTFLASRSMKRAEPFSVVTITWKPPRRLRRKTWSTEFPPSV